MQLIDQHRDVLDEAKSEHEKLKKTVDELRASEVCASRFIPSFLLDCVCFLNQVVLQVDAEYKLQDMKKSLKELEIKGKGYKKRMHDLRVSLSKHMDQ